MLMREIAEIDGESHASLRLAPSDAAIILMLRKAWRMRAWGRQLTAKSVSPHHFGARQLVGFDDRGSKSVRPGLGGRCGAHTGPPSSMITHASIACKNAFALA